MQTSLAVRLKQQPLLKTFAGYTQRCALLALLLATLLLGCCHSPHRLHLEDTYTAGDGIYAGVGQVRHLAQEDHLFGHVDCHHSLTQKVPTGVEDASEEGQWTTGKSLGHTMGTGTRGV